MKQLVLLAILLGAIAQANAQRWKATRQEVFGGIGASNFIGELGGADQSGNFKFIRNLNITDSRPAFTAGYRYQISDLFVAKGAYYFGLMHGDDSKTEDLYRNTRNLNFRAPLHELSIQGEFYFIPEKTGQVFRFQGVKNTLLNHISAYVFTGVGGIFFNPQGELNGQWYKLRELGTEGQGLIPGTDLYSRIALVIPYGAGFKLSVNRQLGFGFEYGSRLTFTDYIDDVSTNYYDNALLRAQRGDLAANLADKNPYPERQSWTSANQQRGNPDSNDFYLFGTFTVYYKLLKGASIKPRF